MIAPYELMIAKGKVTRKAGGTVKYLAAWQRRVKLADREYVCVIASDNLQKLYNEIEFLRQLHMCA